VLRSGSLVGFAAVLAPRRDDQLLDVGAPTARSPVLKWKKRAPVAEVAE
jgi:hypothetical protein